MSSIQVIDNPDAPALTSEVGLRPGMQEDNASVELKDAQGWQKIFELQQKQFFEFINILKGEESSALTTGLAIPEFNPEDSSSDAGAWCTAVDICLRERPAAGGKLIMLLSRSLKGSAAAWLTQVCHADVTWKELREQFLARYSILETPAAAVYRILNAKPNKKENLSLYAVRVVNELISKWKNMTVEEIAAAVTVAHVAGLDSGVKRLALRTNIDSRTKIQQEMLPFTYDEEEQGSVPAKRPRTDTLKQCFGCGKRGHVMKWCRNSQAEEEKQTNEKISECTFCKIPGHTSINCFKRMAAEKKKINLAKDGRDVSNIINLIVGERKFNALFDSGADCSLVRESVSRGLPGPRQSKIVHLKGIGGSLTISLQSILLTCKIDNLWVELEFRVVLDHEIPFDILIGRDVLDIPGMQVTLSKNKICLTKLIEAGSIANICQTTMTTLNTDLSDDHHLAILTDTLSKYNSSFAEGIPESRVTTGELVIRLKNPDKYVYRLPYRLAPVERERLRSILKELLERKIIRESNSPFASPVVLVRKKNGDTRMCVDYRELNSNTLRDHYPLPLISDQLDQLSGAKYFSCLDMAAGFHQIPVAQNSIEKTAFITPEGQYEYLTMPFGLSNAPSVYQRAINKALGDLLNKDALVYMDDVLIPSATIEEGIDRLDRVLSALTKHGFSINIKKCSFLKTSVEYLGFVVADGKIRPSPSKVEALARSPLPTNVKQVRQFNGLASYFRRFIPNFSREMIPLYNLTKTNAKWEWTAEHEAARSKIIEYLTSAPLLTIFKEGLPIELHTDASTLGLGAVLLQIKDGRRHVIGYFSMRTTAAESKYHSYELETLAIVRSVKHFRHYLYGRKFTIITDCNAVKASRYKQELLPRVHRWWAFLQNFDFEVEYRKGFTLQHADFFSRNPLRIVMSVTTKDDWLLVEQRRDPFLHDIIQKLSDDPTQHSDYTLSNNILHYKLRRNGEEKLVKVVPRSYLWSLINTYHEALKHMGWEKTLDKLRETFWFPNMSSTVRNFVDHCIICKTMKGDSGAKQSRLHPIEKIAEPFHTLHIDISGKLNGTSGQNEYVFVTVDAFTKFVILQYAKGKSQSVALKNLQEIVFLFGAPKRIIVDGDRAFISEYRKFCNEFGIELHQCAGYTSRANGQVERVMRIIKNGLTIIKHTQPTHWSTALGSLQLAINCTMSKATGRSPIELLIGKRGCVPPELLRVIDEVNERINPESLRKVVSGNLAERSAQDRERYNKGKATVRRFSKGEYVLLREPPRLGTKLSIKYDGPYEVKRVLPHDRYFVQLANGRGRLRKVCHENLRPTPKLGSQCVMTVSAD